MTDTRKPIPTFEAFIKEAKNLNDIGAALQRKYGANYEDGVFKYTVEGGQLAVFSMNRDTLTKIKDEKFNGMGTVMPYSESDPNVFVLTVQPSDVTINTFNEDQSDTYFDTLSQALEQVNREAVKKGYDEIDPDLFFKFSTGGISYTTTKSDRFELTKGGVLVKNRSMQVQIYRMDSGKYELNCYIA